MEKQKKYDIFISYRHSSGDYAGRLYDRLISKGYSVCYDKDVYNHIANADLEQLTKNIVNCKDFILFLNNTTFRENIIVALCRKVFNRPRPDWVKQEVLVALGKGSMVDSIIIDDKHRKKINIIPITYPDVADMPKNLPAEIAEIAMIPAIKYSSYYYNAFVDSVLKRLLATPKTHDYSIPRQNITREDILLSTRNRMFDL